MSGLRKFLFPFALVVAAMALMSAGLELAPKLAHAQTSTIDLYAVYSGTANSNAAPTQVVAGQTGKRIRVKYISAGVVTAGPVGFYDGNTFTTNVASLTVPANDQRALDDKYFMGGPSATSGKVLTSGNGIYVAAPNGGAIYVNVRYEQD